MSLWRTTQNAFARKPYRNLRCMFTLRWPLLQPLNFCFRHRDQGQRCFSFVLFQITSETICFLVLFASVCLGDILYLMLHSFVVVYFIFFSTFVCLPVVMAFNVVRPHHVDIKKKCHFFTQGAWLPFSLLKWNWGLTDGPILYITSRFIVQGYCPHNFFKCTYWQHSKRGKIRGDPHWLDRVTSYLLAVLCRGCTLH